MSKIPYITERAVPQAQALSSVPIAVANTSAVPEATAALGNSLFKAGTAIEHIKDREDKFNYSIAYSKFLQKSINYQDALEQDPDYINAPNKYKENIAQFKAEALQELGTNNYSQNLREHMNLYEAKNYGQVLNSTSKKQVGSALATVDQQVNANFEAFARTKDSNARFQLLASSVTAFRDALPDTDPEKAIKVQNFTEQVEKRGAMLDLSQRPPDEQIQIINQEDTKAGSTIAKFIPPEERMQVVERAKQAQIQKKNNLVAQMRDNEYIRNQSAVNISTKIIMDGGTVTDIPIDQYAILNETQRNNLTKIQEIKNGTLQRDPIEGAKAYDNYSDMFATNPKEFAKVDTTEIRATVSPNKVDEVLGWHQKAMGGGEAPVSLKEYNDVASETLQQVGIKSNSDKGTRFKTRLNEQAQAFKQEKQRDPNAKELQDMAAGLVVKASFTRGGGWLPDKDNTEIFEGKPQDIIVPEDFSNRIVTQAQQNNLGPLTPEQIKAAYLRKLNAR